MCQLQGPRFHRPGRCGQAQGRGRGLQAPPRALEQHHAQLRLQVGNVAAHGGLARLQRTGRAQQAAVLQHGQKGLDQAPVERGIH